MSYYTISRLSVLKSVRRAGARPFTAVTRVRISLGTPLTTMGLRHHRAILGCCTESLRGSLHPRWNLRLLPLESLATKWLSTAGVPSATPARVQRRPRGRGGSPIKLIAVSASASSTALGTAGRGSLRAACTLARNHSSYAEASAAGCVINLRINSRRICEPARSCFLN
jgi:hypothetical protein